MNEPKRCSCGDAEHPGKRCEACGCVSKDYPRERPCLDPDKMHGAGDQFPGEDFPATERPA